MNSECRNCGWHGDADELNWMILEDDGVDGIGGARVCPECRNTDVVILA